MIFICFSELVLECPKFDNIFINYLYRKNNSEGEKITINSLLDQAKAKYPDLDIQIRKNDNIIEDLFFAFKSDIEQCKIS